MLPVSKTDLARATELAKLLRRAELTLDGVEILAAAQVIAWSSSLIDRIELSLKEQDSTPKKMEVVRGNSRKPR